MPRIRPYNPSINQKDYLFKNKITVGYGGIKNKHEEPVRQWLLKELVETYNYKKEQINVEERIKFGSSNGFADISIKGAQSRKVKILIEVKKNDCSEIEFQEAIKQLESYMSATISAKIGLVTDGNRFVGLIKNKINDGVLRIEDIPTSEDLENGFSPQRINEKFLFLSPRISNPLNSDFVRTSQSQEISNQIPWVQSLINTPQAQAPPIIHAKKQSEDTVIGILEKSEKETFIQKLFAPKTQTYFKNGKFEYSESNEVIKNSKVKKKTKRGVLSLILGGIILVFFLISIGKISNNLALNRNFANKNNSPKNTTSSIKTAQNYPTSQNQTTSQNSESKVKTTTKSNPSYSSQNNSETKSLLSNPNQSDTAQNIEGGGNESQNETEPNVKVYESDNWKETNTTKPSYEITPLPRQTSTIQQTEVKPTVQATPISTPTIEKKVEILEATICSYSGRLPNEYCPSRVTRKFRKNETPTSVCAEHKKKNKVVEFLKKLPNRIP